MWAWAAEIPVGPAADNTGQYLTFFGGVIATLGLIAVAYINANKKSNPPPPPADADANGLGEMKIAVAVLTSKHDSLSDDFDEVVKAFELGDRRGERLEKAYEQLARYLDRNYPGWRSDGST